MSPRSHSRSAESIDGFTRDGRRQSCQQCGHASDIAIVLTGLISTTHQNICNSRQIEVWMTMQQVLDG
jgi:hypothetical protein